MQIYIGVGAILIALLILYAIIRFIQEPALIIGNSIAGILIFLLLNFVFGAGIPINIITVGIVALGGIGGVLLVVLLHLFGFLI